MYSTAWSHVHSALNAAHSTDTLIHQRSSYIDRDAHQQEGEMDSKQRITISVSGSIFETYSRTLNRYPESILGSSEKRGKFYDEASGMLFIPRDRRLFESILYFYQSGGRVIPPEDLPESLLTEELKFFGLYDESNRKDRRAVQELSQISINRQKVLDLLDGGEGDLATLVGYWCIFVVFLYILVLCVQTLPGYDPGIPCNSCNQTHPKNRGALLQSDRAMWIYTETACAVWFALEYTFRLILHPGLSKIFYMTSTLGFIDLCSFVSHFAILSIEIPLQDHEILYQAPYMKYFLYACKFLRFLCVLKLTRYCMGLRLVSQTILHSLDELTLLSFCVLISTVFFSSIIFFCEEESADSIIKSIPDGFYYVIVTMVTVGYGDVVPVTAWGKLFGMACAMFGVCCLLALPTTILVSSFSDMYHERKDDNRESAVVRRLKFLCTGGRRLRSSSTEVTL